MSDTTDVEVRPVLLYLVSLRWTLIWWYILQLGSYAKERGL